MRFTAAILIALILTACSSVVPTQQQLDNADYGQYPDNYRELAATVVSDIQAVGEPQKYWVAVKGSDPPEFTFGYRILITYRTKETVRRTESEPVDTPTGTVIQERVVTSEEMISKDEWWFVRDGRILHRLTNVID